MLIRLSGDIRVSLAALMAWLKASARHMFKVARSVSSRPDAVETALCINATGVLNRSAAQVHVFIRCVGGTSDSRDMQGCTMSLKVGIVWTAAAAAPPSNVSANTAAADIGVIVLPLSATLDKSR